MCGECQRWHLGWSGRTVLSRNFGKGTLGIRSWSRATCACVFAFHKRTGASCKYMCRFFVSNKLFSNISAMDFIARSSSRSLSKVGWVYAGIGSVTAVPALEEHVLLEEKQRNWYRYLLLNSRVSQLTNRNAAARNRLFLLTSKLGSLK